MHRLSVRRADRLRAVAQRHRSDGLVEHYRRLLTVPLYANVMLNTFKTSFIVTLACLAVGYPLAYVMARRNDASR